MTEIIQARATNINDIEGVDFWCRECEGGATLTVHEQGLSTSIDNPEAEIRVRMKELEGMLTFKHPEQTGEAQ